MRRDVTIGNRLVGYLEAGAGRPVVLIHAFPLDAEMWRPQLDRVPSGWRLITPDLRGFGPTGGNAAGRVVDGLLATSVDDYASDILALLDHLGIDRAVVGGLSMGGYVTFALLRHAQARARVAGLVLADTRAGADTEEGRAGRRRMQALVDRDGAAGVARDLVPRLLGQTTVRDRPEVVARVTEMIEAASPLAIRSALAGMMSRPDATPLLATIDCPTLVIVGDEDVLTPVAEAERLHRAIRGSTLAVLSDAGHLSNVERPDAFHEALWCFLQEQPS